MKGKSVQCEDILPGSACHSGEHVMSSVLKAMKVEPIWGLGTLRFSIGRMTTEEEVLNHF